MEVGISRNIDVGIREKLVAWVRNARELLLSENILPQDVVYVLLGEQESFASWLLSVFTKRVYVILTKDGMHIIKCKWLSPLRKISTQRFALSAVKDIRIKRRLLSEEARLFFSDGTKLRIKNIDKQMSEPLERVVKEGIDVLIT